MTGRQFEAKTSALVALSVFLFLLLAGGSAFGAVEDPEDLVYSGVTAYGTPIWKPYMADLKYLEAGEAVVGGRQVMSISIGLDAQNPMADSMVKLSIFIDSNTDRSNGCILPGCPRGAEYRIDATVMPGSLLDPTKAVSTQLWQLPETMEQAAQYAQENAATRNAYPARLAGSGTFTATTANGLDHVRLDIPVMLLGNTSNANIWVLSYLPHLSSVNPFQRQDLPNKQGDRIPDVGEYNTATGTVVNAAPTSELVTINDPLGDNLSPQGPVGPDLRQVQYQTVGDSVFMKLVFQDDLVQSIWDPNVSFTITFDSDRHMETGQIFMGNTVPTWGGDVAIDWVSGPVGVHGFYMSYGSNTTSPRASFGGPTSGGEGAFNDARWDIIGNVMLLQFPKSLLDIYRFTDLMPGYPIGEGIFERLPAADDVLISVRTYVQNTPLLNAYTDWAPTKYGAFDTAAVTALEPLAFSPAKVLHLTEPDDSAYNAALDIRSVDYQVDNDQLIIKATIGNWIRDERSLIFEVHLDADANPNTGYSVVNQGVKLLGSDYLIEVTSFDDSVRAGYELLFGSSVAPNGSDAKTLQHDAWLKVEPPPVSSPFGAPGTITITIPRSEIPLAQDRVNAVFRSGKQMRFAGQPPIVTYYDYLPNSGSQLLANFTEKVNGVLSATVAGNGGGTINSSGGFTCSSGTCTRSFPLGTSINLFASPDANSVFTGWSGGCSGVGTCSLLMNDDRAVTATFSQVAPVRVAGTTSRNYSTIGAALASIPNGAAATVQARRGQLTENVVLDRDIKVTFRGGYDTSYIRQQTYTTIRGRMIIRRGGMDVENLAVR